MRSDDQTAAEEFVFSLTLLMLWVRKHICLVQANQSLLSSWNDFPSTVLTPRLSGASQPLLLHLQVSDRAGGAWVCIIGKPVQIPLRSHDAAKPRTEVLGSSLFCNVNAKPRKGIKLTREGEGSKCLH